MTQNFHGSSSECTEKILCCYVNGTSNILITRITNIPNWYFERVVFPKERFLFEAPPAAQLEIHRSTLNEATLSDSISCKYLRVGDSNSTSKVTESSNTIANAKMVNNLEFSRESVKI
ncbi:DUF1830 domain-containing protein [Lyngbya aestuarii]|uniref:DUF1830 domain-containing protein n=1 Tax=Lyngbya aestuarii TaxID=118322 RepID=UPI00403DDCC7